MKKTRFLRYLFNITSIVLLFICIATGCKKEIINCSFEFLNSETGEYVKAFGKNNFGEIYLTYDGKQKTSVSKRLEMIAEKRLILLMI